MTDQLKTEIRTWLENPERDYNTGVQLLMQNGKLRHLTNTLQRKQNSEKLIYELSKLCPEAVIPEEKALVLPLPDDAGQQAAAVKGLEGVGPVVVVTGNDAGQMLGQAITELEKLPEAKNGEDEAAEISSHMTTLFNKRVQLSNTLADLKSDEERKAVVDEIDAIQEQYNQLAERKQIIETTGKAPVEPEKKEAKPMSPGLAELKAKRQALAPNVTKAKKKAAEKADDPIAQEKYTKLQLELDAIDLQIKAAREAENNKETASA